LDLSNWPTLHAYNYTPTVPTLFKLTLLSTGLNGFF